MNSLSLDPRARLRSGLQFSSPPTEIQDVGKARELYFLRLESMMLANQKHWNDEIDMNGEYNNEKSATRNPSVATKSDSIAIKKQSRYRASSSKHGFTEDMALFANVLGSYTLVEHRSSFNLPSPRDDFVPPHLVQYSSGSDFSMS